MFPILGHSQEVHQATQSAHSLIEDGHDIVMFYESMNNPFTVQKFGSAHISAASSFDGVLITSHARMAKRAAEIITAKKKIFYPIDLEWKCLNPLPYEFLLSTYRDSRLEIIARSQSHKWAIENAFNLTDVRIIEDFNIRKMLE